MNQGIQQHSTGRGLPQPMSTDSSGTLHNSVFIEPPHWTTGSTGSCNLSGVQPIGRRDGTGTTAVRRCASCLA